MIMKNTEFIEFFKAQLMDDSTVLSLDTVFKDIPEWDSLTTMLFISNLKDEHSVDITIADLQNCKTLGDIYDLIISK
jgi:acyl carrier protein